MRGIMYEISKDPKWLGSLNADNFSGTDEGRAFASWYGDTDKEEVVENLQQNLAEYGVFYGEENSMPYIEFSRESKESYFAKKFTEFMNCVKDLSIKTFASKTMETIQYLIEDSYDDAVYLAEHQRPITMDQFVREAEPGIRYYVGNAIDMY